MLREDYQALFYRNINTIIELEALQQTQLQAEQLISHLSYVESDAAADQKTNPILSTSQESAKYHSKMRRQMALQRKKEEL